MEEYTASSFLPKEDPIDSISVQYEKLGHDDKGWLVNMYAQEIGGGRNFYLMKAYKNGVLLTDSTYEYRNISDNTGFNGQYYNGFSVYWLSEHKTDERLQSGDTVTIEMDGITGIMKSLYWALLMSIIQNSIFSGPSANVPTNIEPKDRAVGFFAAYSAFRKSKVYNGE